MGYYQLASLFDARKFSALLPPKIDADFNWLLNEANARDCKEILRQAMITYKNLVLSKKRGCFYFQEHNSEDLQPVVFL
ncbi:hypothetical protein OMCYN_01743 [cyanobiont of Ornithocercus magnificus]|nr:hypothetical protein OMCYN_01743 [cyanobiont of Ornithocercus magnificus]